MAEPGFWDDSMAAQSLINANNSNKETYDRFHRLASQVEELEMLLEMLQDEYDVEIETELLTGLRTLKEEMSVY